MEKSEVAAGAVAAGAPVVRQLDFTVNNVARANSGAKRNSLLPEAQLQPKWLSLGEPQQLHGLARAQSPPRPVAQTKLPPRKMIMPPKSPHRELPRSMAPRLGNPLVQSVPMSKAALQPLPKMESPNSRKRCNPEQNDGTPKKQKQCKCRNSRCLKLYCECFASGVYCDGCNCVNCHNKVEYEAHRKESIEAILERKPDAFRPKIGGSPNGAVDGGVEHNKGCNCKKSGCLKRYCECFQANILCSDKCKCMDCKNFEGSEERKVHFHQHAANSLAFMQQAANAAINEAIGTPIMTSRNQHNGFEVVSNKQTSWIPHFQQETHLTSDASCSSSSSQLSKPEIAVLGPSKVSYRSPLAGVLQSQHVKDFCQDLVEVSIEAAKSFSERKMIKNGMDVNKAGNPVPSYQEDSKDHQDQQNTSELCANQGNSDRTSLCESDGNVIHHGRPLSPGTLALMCDERDATFMEANTPPAVTESTTSMNLKLASTSTNGISQLYVEQERLALSKLRSFLNRLITCGSIEEMRVEKENP